MVSASTSTQTAVAPTWWMAAVVEMSLFGTVMTSSPGPIPRASSATLRAAVPELVPTAWGVPSQAANSVSNSGTSGPQSSSPRSITRR